MMTKSGSVSHLNNNKNYSLQRQLASWRYWCMRLVSCPMPGLKASFPIIGGRTLIEIICFLMLVLMAVSLAMPDNKDAGEIGDLFGAATTIFGLRNNLLQVLFGISYERALFWHKVMGSCTLGIICFHALIGFDFTGFMICVSMGLMALTYFIKNMSFPHAFEVFYYTHFVSILLIMVFGQLHHDAVWFSLSGLLWIVDVLMRSFVTSQTLTAHATSLPAGVIQLSFEGSVEYKAGQYAFLRIPAVNKVEFHPFSFSSCPQQDTVTVHIRELGDWTRRLGDLVREHDKSGADGALSLEVMLDGPYGNMQVDVQDPQYEVFVLISGGIGITPNQSLYNSLASEAETGRQLRKVLFLWSVKDKAIINTMTPSLLSSGKMLGPDLTPLSFQPAMVGRGPDNLSAANTPPLAVVTKNEDVELRSSPASGAVSKASSDRTPGDIESASPLAPFSSSNASSSSKMIFENRFYLTQLRDESHFKDANISPEVQPWLHFGRPDISAVFDEVRSLVRADKVGTGRSRVCVSVCGPSSMVQDVQELCRISHLGCADVAFDCHAEVFDF
mmetsp:Transcript_14500/g.27116  ORF Transcript_14500/g.27116 Transcript_14500/m.27116 type:complete len:558 (+) Transcript_14500:142-1815(+)